MFIHSNKKYTERSMYLIDPYRIKPPVSLGFEAFVAPANFDRTAQEVDIYAKFGTLLANDATASWIFSCTPAIQVVLPAVTNVQYIYGETISGTETVSSKIASGTVFTSGSTKRWVSAYYTGASSIAVTLPAGSVWGYIYSNLIYSINSYSNTYLKYLHLAKLSAFTTLIDSAFFNCTGLTGILNIPNSIVTITNYAFYSCTGFTGSLNISNSVIEIGTGAFTGCSGLTGSLNIPNSVINIGINAFNGCTGFTGSLNIIGNASTTIGLNAFLNGNYSSITSQLEKYPAFDNVLYDIATSGKVKAVANAQSYVGGLTLRNDTTDIICSFTKRTGQLTIPNSVTTIGDSAFKSCTGLSGLLTIPNSVITLALQAFQFCTGFTSLTIGSSVTSIGQQVFAGCTNISLVNIYSSTAPTVAIYGLLLYGTARPLHIPVTNSGYNVAPWTDTSIFSQIIADL